MTLLLILLIKSKLLRVKMSLLGSVIGLILLTGFLLSTGLLTLVAGGAVAYGVNQNKA
ncbi:putative conserved membrane protein [Synechococcus sp. BIOS-U3-1]|nr:putative conserved membrane protein [Synechococcus sp. BIOS-U3-1]